VNAFVLLQVAALRKRLVASAALERLFASVNPLVPFQVAALSKRLVAPRALERPVAGVDPQVLLQVTCSRKRLWAPRAGMVPLPSLSLGPATTLLCRGSDGWRLCPTCLGCCCGSGKQRH